MHKISKASEATYMLILLCTEDIDIVMPMYNLLEYNGNYAKRPSSLWQYCRDEPDDNITDSK